LTHPVTHVKQSVRRHDGRGAHFALHNQFLGPNNTNDAASKAEAEIESVRYVGERRRFTFETYTRILREQFDTLNDLAERNGHAGIDAASQVRKLLSGIKTSKLDVIKSQILASPALRQDLDACINLYDDCMSHSLQSDPNFNISSLQFKGRKPDVDVDDLPGEPVEDRFYTPDEYAQLSAGQKSGLRAMREARGQKTKRERFGECGRGGDAKKETLDEKLAKQAKSIHEKMDKQFAAMNRQISSINGGGGEETKDGAGDGADAAGNDAGPNRGHPALTRQRGGLGRRRG